MPTQLPRDRAWALLRKLEALADPARGGTPAERAVARHKADALRLKYRLDREPPRTEPRPQTRQPFTAPSRGPAWFNVATGEAGPGVRVHSYKDRRNWRIEYT